MCDKEEGKEMNLTSERIDVKHSLSEAMKEVKETKNTKLKFKQILTEQTDIIIAKIFPCHGIELLYRGILGTTSTHTYTY